MDLTVVRFSHKSNTGHRNEKPLINHWFKALRIHVMKQKHSNHLGQTRKDGKREVKLQREKSRFKWKQGTFLHQSFHMKPAAGQRESHSSVPRWPIPSGIAAPQEIAGAVSLSAVWLYIISHLSVGPRPRHWQRRETSKRLCTAESSGEEKRKNMPAKRAA